MNFPEEHKNEILKIFKESFSEIKNAHDKNTGCLRNSYIRKVFYEKNYDYIKPIEIEFPSNSNKKFVYHYVPILKTLEKYP